jgi:predicted transcriptional regulator
MIRPQSPEKTTITLEADVRQYLERRAKEEGRTLKWLINNAVRKEMLAESALQTQPELFREKV